MVRLAKLVIVGFSLFAIFTAAPAYKMAMYNGVMAYALAMKDACVRPNGPCSYAEKAWKSVSLQESSI